MPVSPPLPSVQWREDGQERTALWRSERRAAPPKRVVVVDDTLSADRAFRLVCEGSALLWRGDFHLAKQLLQALGRRAEATGQQDGKKGPGKKRPGKKAEDGGDHEPAGQAFQRYRQRRSRRAQLMASLLVPVTADYRIPLRRAPETRLACSQAWGDPSPDSAVDGDSWVALSELLGILGAFEWRRRGVEVAALGEAPNNRMHPHYGVFAPTRDAYVGLVHGEPLPEAETQDFIAFDIGTGCGVLAAVLARRGVPRVVATDLSRRAVVCARENLERLGLAAQVEVLAADLFPPGRASLVVCNPPWLPGRPTSTLEEAVYDPQSRMLHGFLAALGDHLLPGGEGWLVLSDLAERLGLRSRRELLQAIDDAGLVVVGRSEVAAQHPKASRESDPLHWARAEERISLWRLVPLPDAAPGQKKEPSKEGF